MYKKILLVYLNYIQLNLICFYSSAINSSNAIGYLSPKEVSAADDCFPDPKCDANYQYRTFDGSCNNLRFPTWGQAERANIRIIEADYSDGIYNFLATILTK